MFADGHVVLLTKDNLNILAHIIDPVFGVQQLAYCQMRITNSNGHSCPPHIAAMESADAATLINQAGTPQKHKRMKKGTKALTPTSNKKRKIRWWRHQPTRSHWKNTVKRQRKHSTSSSLEMKSKKRDMQDKRSWIIEKSSS